MKIVKYLLFSLCLLSLAVPMEAQDSLAVSGIDDMAASTICISEERRKSVDFSDPWIYEASALITRYNDNYHRRGSMHKNRVLSKSCNLFIEFMRWMPQVVFLMIMFYVVFGGIDISSMIVAIIWLLSLLIKGVDHKTKLKRKRYCK